jgi:hypothetical protein
VAGGVVSAAGREAAGADRGRAGGGVAGSGSASTGSGSTGAFSTTGMSTRAGGGGISSAVTGPGMRACALLQALAAASRRMALARRENRFIASL